MNPAQPSLLPATLEAAVQRVKQAVRAAAERTVESLGLSALSASSSHQRDTMLAAQFELNRKLGAFVQTFGEAFDEQVRRECGPRGQLGSDGSPASWNKLSLVENHELEIKVLAERFGLEITQACEWELRELEAYVGSVLGHARAERERNPLRPEIVGQGVIRAAEAIIDRPEVRKVLDAELTRSLAAVLRSTYGEIVSDLRKAGVQPVSLTVRTTEDRGGEHSRAGALDALPREHQGDSSRSGHDGLRDTRQSMSGSLGPRSTTSHGTLLGQVDPAMMDLLRRLAYADRGGGGAAAAAGADSGSSVWSADISAFGSVGGQLPNLIHVNRDVLKQASRGALDHMVIDVIGSLFDQILSDPKVPPQLARQIARLQLPVLRAALGDATFFSSRKHPVRLFINRVASLGNGFDDFSDVQAQTFVAKVRDLVQEIVKGDFDQIETYEKQLTALEAFVAAQAREAVEAQQAGATALLQQREEALRLDRQYAQRLEDDLHPLAAPEFVRDFVSRVWSRVILKAAEREGVTSEKVRALRHAGRELFMSVQPKTSPAQRKVFLAELPKLMQQVNAGLNSIGWPEARRREFFGKLMPAHADSLKAQPGSVLDFNMLARQVEQALERGIPTRDDLPPASASDPVAEDLSTPTFTREEAARIGFVEENTFDWNGKIDIDLSAEPEVSAVDLELPGLPAPSELVAPASGRSLADHVQIGFSYQMHLEGDWQRVRLAHVSPGRSFFVFTRGGRHQQTISLTHRMLARLCETGRMRAFESAQLLERATARARRQLASLSGAPAGR